MAFVCYPHKEAHDAVAALIDAGIRVVDLSADFRLKDPEGYSTWYNFVHPRPDLVAEAVYGVPELYREEIAKARLVANPGCYPTSVLLGVAPVAGEIDGMGVIADSKSGVSGAGRTPSEKTHFCSVTEDFKAYSEVGHRHTSEMLQELALMAGRPLPVSFTPHLLPVDRGILSTLYFKPVNGFIGQDAWLAKYRELLRRRDLRGGCRARPGTLRSAGHQLLPHDRAGGQGRGPGEGVLGHRQSCERRFRPSRAEHELHVRSGGGSGTEEESMSGGSSGGPNHPIVVAPLTSRIFTLPAGVTLEEPDGASPGATHAAWLSWPGAWSPV